jgi:TonB family protein
VTETTEIEIVEEDGQTTINKTVMVVKTDDETPMAKVRHIVISSDTTLVFAGDKPKISSIAETDGSKIIHKTIVVQKDMNLDELILLDGEEISSEQLASLAPEQIQSINVIKGKGATEKYGDKGAGGVLEIISQQPQEEKPVFTIADVMPEFPGGDKAMVSFIGENIKYPEAAMNKGIQGKVYITFVVSETGVVENARVIRGVEASLDAEALRVIKSMPKWTPGQVKGKDVAVMYTVPIKFALEKKQTPEK